MSQSTPPRWQDLLANYLQRSPDREAEGLSEVEPYQAQPALGLDLATAWRDALLPGVMLGEAEAATSAYPDAWLHARSHTWAAPFPCCVGMAPQFLQQIQGLMRDARHFFQTASESRPAATTANVEAGPSWLGQLAEARVTGDFARAATLLEDHQRPKLLLQNERAAQAWLRGDRKSAARLWNEMSGSEPVVAFNQALAALSLGDTKTGVERLRKASAGFDESTGWRHLAELYRVALGD